MAARLAKPREEAHQKIEAQIEAGRKLLRERGRLLGYLLLTMAGDCESEAACGRVRADIRIWKEYTEQLLLTLFTDDSEAQRFSQNSGTSPLLSRTGSKLESAITKLKSLLTRLPLIEEDVIPSTANPQPEADKATGNTFKRDGNFWRIAYEGQLLPSLGHLDGFLYIAHLLQHPNQTVHVSTLRALKDKQQPDPRHQPYEKMSQEQLAEEGLNNSALSGTEAAPDHKTIAQVRAKKAEIEEELRAMDEDSTYLPDPDKWAGEDGEDEDWKDRVEVKEKLKEQLNKLTEYLGAGTGLGGRPRKVAGKGEKDRVAVTKAVKAAIARIEKKHQPLGTHLSRCIDTGNTCTYLPENPITWTT